MSVKDRLDNPARDGELGPMIDRLEGDVMHDCFVPRYSTATEGKPKLIHLIGWWLIFFPAVITTPLPAIGVLFAPWAVGGNVLLQWLVLLISLVIELFILLILYKVTARYIRHRQQYRFDRVDTA